MSGVDIAQSLSGLRYKLLAYEELLRSYPIWRERVVLVQRCLIPGSRKADEANTARECRTLVQRIRSKFGDRCIDYVEMMGCSSLPMPERLALWAVSDMVLQTPIREGLNLLPLEYIYSRRKGPPGLVVASEFSAVCTILNGALRVNPFDVKGTAGVIDKALTMDTQEREVSERTKDRRGHGRRWCLFPSHQIHHLMH